MLDVSVSSACGGTKGEGGAAQAPAPLSEEQHEQQERGIQQDVVSLVCCPPLGPCGKLQQPSERDTGGSRILPSSHAHQQQLQQRKDGEQKPVLGWQAAKGAGEVSNTERHFAQRPDSIAAITPCMPPTKSSSASCDSCRGRYFHPPKVLSAPARSEEDLLRPPPDSPYLRRDLAQHPQALISHCTIQTTSTCSEISSSTGAARAAWWTAEAQRELFLSPYDAAGFPRGLRGVPVKRLLTERGAVSVDLKPVFPEQQNASRPSGEQQKQHLADTSSSSSSATCSRCKGLRLTFSLPVDLEAAPRGPLPLRASSRRHILSRGLQVSGQQRQPREHASDDSSASSGSEIAEEELLPDAYLRLAGRQRSLQTLGVEGDWLMRLQDPPQGIEALDVFAAAAAASAAPIAHLAPLANSPTAAGLLDLFSRSRSLGNNATIAEKAANQEWLLNAKAPHRPRTFLERMAAFALSRARTAPSLRLSLPQQQQQQQQLQRQPLPMLAALISGCLELHGARSAASAAAAGGDPAVAAGRSPSARRRNACSLQGKFQQLDPRLLRKALRCFDRNRGGLSRSGDSSTSSNRILADFAAVKTRLVGLALGDIPFDPDGLWLRRQQAQQQQRHQQMQRQQQQQLVDAEHEHQHEQQHKHQQQQRREGLGAPRSSTLPLMQAAMRRVRLSAKYKHPSVRIGTSRASSSGRINAGGGFWQKASVGLGCGVALATHAASAGPYYFEVLVGPLPPQQQQQQLLLQQPKQGLSPTQQQHLQQQRIATSSQCDLRVGWSTRRHPPSAPLGATRDSVALTLRGMAAWAGVELPYCFPPLVEGDVVGCCIRLVQPQQEQQPRQADCAAVSPTRGVASPAKRGAPAAAPAGTDTTVSGIAGDAYSVSCLMDVDRLAQGFLRSAAGLAEGSSSSSSNSQPVGAAAEGSLVQFTVNGRPLGCCRFSEDPAGCLLADEYFPAISLMGGASCSVNFGPSFRHPPPLVEPPFLPCCLLPLSTAPPLTYDVYPLLLLPQQLLADPQLNTLRPRTLVDVLEERILALPSRQQPLSSAQHNPRKRKVEEALGKGSHDADSGMSADGGMLEECEDPALTPPAGERRGASLQHTSHACGEFSGSPETLEEGREATGHCCCNRRTEKSATEARALCCCRPCGADPAEIAMLQRAASLIFAPEELRQLQKGLQRQHQQQQLLESVHRCAFEAQLKSCNAVLDAAAKEWGLKRAHRLRRRMPWARHRCNMRSSSGSESSSESSSSEESDACGLPLAGGEANRDVASAGEALEGSVFRRGLTDDATAAVSSGSAPSLAAEGQTWKKGGSSDCSGSRVVPFVDFKHPCSVLFSFLLPTLRGLHHPGLPASPAAAVSRQAPTAEASCRESAAVAESLAAWKRFARLFWLVVAPLDSQRRPLSPRVFIRNQAVSLHRKSKPPPFARTAAASSAGGRPVGSIAAASDVSAAGTGDTGAQPSGRASRSGSGMTRRKGGSSAGPAGGAAAAEASYETIQVGQLTLRVPQGCLADSGDETGQLPPDLSQEGGRQKRPAAGRSVAAEPAERDEGMEASALIESLPLSVVLLRRLGLKPRQLLEALGCKFRLVSRQLAGSHAAIAGVSCIYTAVVRLRQLQAKAQAADEEAAKDVACEFWIEQYAGALCGS
ncbi:uncharacterized protein LOC34618641 [Cyclospora cayetanensis]|uniref:Uncharacterized protein LOC34618641 n=1 Tax=Cyclospora cayetanensis TaxID=88456 RepID=A0A6P6RZ03_9EIME|nr:uncharacterized protein LOC34618641 [Cyclospora cayetanensis]